MLSLALAFTLLTAAPPPPAPAAERPSPAERVLEKGSSFASLSASWTISGGEHLWQGHAGFGYFLANRFSLELDLVGGWVDYGRKRGPTDRTWLFGPDAFARYHVLRIGILSLYGDVGAGMRLFGSDFPVRGTRFNFALQTGLGLQVMALGRFGIAAGARFFHISNSSLAGSDRNPAHNATQFYAGLVCAF
jgi:hypothetical protein